MKKTALVSTLAIAVLPNLSSAQTAANAPSYCQGYQPDLISMGSSRGAYMRVSPDGNYVIVSNGNSQILDLTGKDSDGKRVVKQINTRMNAEAYPVEGNWNYITSPGSQMAFFRFKDLLEKGLDVGPGEIVDRRAQEQAEAKAKTESEAKSAARDRKGSKKKKQQTVAQAAAPAPDPSPSPSSTQGLMPNSASPELFVDREHTSPYYQSAAELPGGDKTHATYRVSLYSSDTIRDYEVWFNQDGSAAKVEKKPIKPLCQNITKDGQTFQDRHVSQPIISKDGTEFAGSWRGTTTIFKINDDGTCTVEDSLGISSYKVSFSYPEPGKRAKIVFTNAQSFQQSSPGSTFRPSQAFNNFGTFIYDPNTKKMTPVQFNVTGYSGAPSYPGWTKDGRILAQVQGNQGPAIAVIDPKKLIPLPDFSKLPDNKLAKNCFQDAETYAQAMLSIGQVWSSVCSALPGNSNLSEMDQMKALSLDPANCVKMVHENFQTWKDRHPDSTLTEAHLSAACKVSRTDQ